MICLVGNRPILQVGDHQVVAYNVEWIEIALYRASIAADRDDFPFIAEIRDGIVHYLENRCPLRLLPIEDLYGRMRRMLERIGCEAIGNHLTILTPPIRVSLVDPATKTSEDFENCFYQQLLEIVLDLRRLGTEEVIFFELHEAARTLCGTKTWDEQCDKTLKEISDFLKKTAEQNSTPDSQLTLTLETA